MRITYVDESQHAVLVADAGADQVVADSPTAISDGSGNRDLDGDRLVEMLCALPRMQHLDQLLAWQITCYASQLLARVGATNQVKLRVES